jgi:hypothetical protein
MYFQKTNHYSKKGLGSLVLLASLFEHHLALMCACAPSLRAIITREMKNLVSKSLFTDKQQRKKMIKQALRIESPDINELPPRVRSPSFDAVHTLSLTQRPAEGVGTLVPVAYGGDGIRLDEERTPGAPLTPTLTRPDRVLRLSGLSRLSGFSRFTLQREGFQPRTSLLPANSRTPLRQPSQPEMRETSFNRTEPAPPPTPTEEIDPAMNPKFVACRGCGGYHEHGYRHDGSSRQKGRGSGTANWWGRGTERIKSWRGSRSQSISVYADPDELRGDTWT